MNTKEAFAQGVANSGKELMVFDWTKAALLIKERGAKEASAGLQGDWGWTVGKILENGKPVKEEEAYTYLASTWAVPELELDGWVTPCFLMRSQTPGWDSGTFWPEEAVKILFD